MPGFALSTSFSRSARRTRRAEGARAPFEALEDGVRVRVRLVPKAARAGIEGVVTGSHGHACLKVRVGAPPEGGKANRELIKLLARAWAVPASRLRLVSGARSREKTLVLSGEPAPLMARLSVWMREKDV